MFIRLFVKSPADTSSAIDSAICVVASIARNRAAERAPDGWPAWPLSVDARSGRVLWSAGNSPNRKPVAIVTAAVKRSSRRSSVQSNPVVANTGSIDAIRSSVHRATRMPAAPPAAASSSDSVSSCAASCARLAPIDSLTAISPARPAARASRRLAMLAHAMRSTNTVTPKSSRSDPPAFVGTPLCPRAPGSTRIGFARNFAIVCGLIPFCSGASTSVRIGRYTDSIAACARSIVTPGFSRANRYHV